MSCKSVHLSLFYALPLLKYLTQNQIKMDLHQNVTCCQHNHVDRERKFFPEVCLQNACDFGRHIDRIGAEFGLWFSVSGYTKESTWDV